VLTPLRQLTRRDTGLQPPPCSRQKQADPFGFANEPATTSEDRAIYSARRWTKRGGAPLRLILFRGSLRHSIVLHLVFPHRIFSHCILFVPSLVILSCGNPAKEARIAARNASGST